MKNRNLINSIIVSTFSILVACQQVTIRIEKIPANTPQGANIYISGNFNFWDPGDRRYMLDYNKDGSYSIELPVTFGNIEYKFTRGDWSTVERDRCGNDISNRLISNFDKTEIINSVESWADLEPLECDSVVLIIKKLPANTPQNASIKIAGNFNAWNPANDSMYIFNKDAKTGNYSIVLKKKSNLLLKDFNYKIVRNNFTEVETDKYGNEIETRKIDLSRDGKVYIEVENWMDLTEPSLNSVAIVLTKVPKNTPANDKIYITGNFNNWNPGDRNFIFRKTATGTYIINLPRQKYGLSFKITRGNWETQAADKRGKIFDDQNYNYSEIDTIYLAIDNWADIKPRWPEYYTFIVDQLPQNTPKNQEIYLVGTYNDWESHEPESVFRKDKNGKLFLTLKKKGETFQYKITRGNWQTQEYLEYSSRLAQIWDDTIHIKIEEWSDQLKSNNDLVRVEVTKVPRNTSPNDNIYIAGGFNGWDPDNKDYILKKNINGTFMIDLPRNWLKQGFKFTRGSWEKVEGSWRGNYIENRYYSGNDKVLKIEISGWED